MATFCTPNDVRAALTPGGTASDDDDQSAASLADWQLLDAIDEAEGVVKSYLTGYTIPIEEHLVDDPDNPENSAIFYAAPDPVRRWTRTIAAYLAALTYRISKDLEESDPIRLRYNMVLQLLADVRAGLVALDPEVFPPTDATGHQVGIFNLYEGTLFGPEDFNLGPGQSPQVLIPGSTEFWDGFSG